MHSSFLECTQKCSALWRQHFLKWAAATAAPAGVSALFFPVSPPWKKKKNLDREWEMRVGGKSTKSAKPRNVFSLKPVCLKGLGRWRRERQYHKWSDPTAPRLHSATSIREAESEDSLCLLWTHIQAAGLANRTLSVTWGVSSCLKSLFHCLSLGTRLRNTVSMCRWVHVYVCVGVCYLCHYLKPSSLQSIHV